MLTYATNKIKIQRLIALALVFLSTTACNKTTDLNDHPDFSPLIQKEYKTNKDFAVIKNDDNLRTYVLEHLTEFDIPDLANKSFPLEYYDKTIYGILGVGSVIKIQKIQRVQSIEWNSVDYYAVVQSTGMFQGYTVDATLLTDLKNPTPKPDPKYIEEVIQK